MKNAFELRMVSIDNRIKGGAILTIKKILYIVIAIIFIILLIQNTQAVTLTFLFWKISMSRILLYPLLICIGFLTGWFFCKMRKK